MIHYKVNQLLGVHFNKKSLAEELGISRPALDSKISQKTPWKKLEIWWIENTYFNLYGKD